LPAHVEYQLLARIIEDGDLKTVLQEKITPNKFGIPETRAAFEYIIDYHQDKDTRNLVPALDKLLDFMPTLELPKTSDRTTLKSLCGEVRDEWIRRQLEMAATNAFDLYEQDPSGAVDRMIQDCKLLQVTAHKSKDLDYADSASDAWKEYQRIKNAKGVTGIPFPVGWGYHEKNGKPKILKKTGRQAHPLNDQTQGIQSEDLILLYGRPKSMKTWVLVDMINECYFHYNYRTLVFSKEMPPEQLRKRIVARMLGLDYKLYSQGQLSDEQEEEFYDTVMNLKDEEMRFRKKGVNRGMLITSGWEEGSWFTGLASVQQKIEEFEPDICFLDAAYLLDDDVTSNQAIWQTILKLAYGLKKMCSHNGIPIVATTQANRKGEETKGSTMSEIAYGDAFAQACDLAVRVIKRENDDGGVLLSMVIAGAREIKMAGFELEAEPAVRFQLSQVYESQRQIMAAFKAEEEMAAIEEEKAARKARRQMSFDTPNPNAGDGCE
jgi:replicative DNA helicase